MSGLWDLDRIGTAFEEAAVDPRRWNAAMDVVARETDGFGAALFPHRGNLPGVPHSEAMVPSLDAYFRHGWVHRDDRFSGLPLLLRNGVVTDLDIVASEEIRRRPYYQEFLSPFGLRWFAGVKVAAGANSWVLSIQRTIAQGPFSTADLKKLRALSRRLSAAAAMAQALGQARADGALAAFQSSGTAAVLFDRTGEVFRINQAAEAMLGVDLQIRMRRLVSRARDATARLDHAIHRLLWGASGDDAGTPVVLPRTGLRPIVAYPLRLAGLGRDFMAPAWGAVVLIDLEPRGVPAQDALRKVFGLTGAEAQLTLLLCDGSSLEGAAERLGIAYETARSRIKAVFAKTDTARQSELVALADRLLIRNPAAR